MKTHSNEQSTRNSHAPYRKGLIKREQILETAKDLLIDDGAAEFTMRRIAAMLKMSLGNLQHYFRTKEELIDGLVSTQIKNYEIRMAAHVLHHDEPVDRLKALAEFMVVDFRTKEGSVLFWELWALSAHNAGVARIVNAFHENERRMIRDILAAVAPRLSKPELDARATVVASMFEGIGLFVAKGRPQAKSHKEVAEQLKTAALAVAKA